jgi:Carboxypeptidase regulatory-like domain/TonB dependent receptor
VSRVRLAALFILVVLNAALATAEGVSSRVTGKVSAGGKPLAGVRVMARSTAMLGPRSTVTGSDGMYALEALPPGTYSITFSTQGMQTLTRVAILELAQTSLTDATLEPGDPDDSVTSTAHKETVQATPQVATTIGRKFIEEMPVTRDSLGRTELAPGIMVNPIFPQLMLSGSDPLVLAHGIPDLARLVEDAVDQVTVISAAVPAEYGRFGGGVVTLAIPNGADTFSGSLRETLSSGKWMAAHDGSLIQNSSSLDTTSEATLGGRLVPGRLWFFAAGRYAHVDAPVHPLSPPFGGLSEAGNRELARLYALLTGAQTLAGTYARSSDQFEYQPSGLPAADRFRVTYDTAVVHYAGAFGPRLTIEGEAGRVRFAGTPIPNSLPSDLDQHSSHEAVKASYAIDGVAGLHALSAGVQNFHADGPGFNEHAKAAFIEDRWTFGRRWSFDAGVRYDQAGGLSGVTPRAGLVFDVRADGRARISANYAQYYTPSRRGVISSSRTVGDTTLAYGFQIGSEGSARVAWSRRTEKDRAIGFSSSPTSKLDVVTIDGGYRLLGLLQVGGSYTWLVASHEDTQLNLFRDDIHNVNVWVQGDLPLSVGQLNVSLLQRHRSVADIRLPIVFGEPHADAVNATDLAMTWSVPVRLVTLSIKPELLNLFNNQGLSVIGVPMQQLPPIPRYEVQVPRTFRVTAAARF